MRSHDVSSSSAIVEAFKWPSTSLSKISNLRLRVRRSRAAASATTWSSTGLRAALDVEGGAAGNSDGGGEGGGEGGGAVDTRCAKSRRAASKPTPPGANTRSAARRWSMTSTPTARATPRKMRCNRRRRRTYASICSNVIRSPVGVMAPSSCIIIMSQISQMPPGYTGGHLRHS